MDSGSSGSFQSSSGGVGGGGGGGGEEEYDSRGEPMSSFLNSQQQMFLSYHQQNPPFFHPSSDHSQNLGASLILQNANFQEQYNNNEQMGWSRGNYGNFGNFSSTTSASSSLPSSSNQAGMGRMINQNQASPSLLLQSGGGSGGGEEAINNPPTAANQPPPPNVGATTKSTTNPKKRTRASRRAPTTVLTTDTTNFRQMVQEFTGIPAAPFSSNPGGGATFGRRLDLFSSGGAASMRGGHQLDHLSSLYPLRPSPQKLTHHPSSLLGAPSSSSSPSLLSSSLIMNAIGNPNSNNASISSNTLGLPQHLKQPPPHQNILSMQNQLLNFQPLVQSSLSPSIFNTATRPHHQGSPSMNHPPSLDELGSFLNQQRSSGEVERQSSWREDQGGRNLNNEGQDGQHRLGGTFDGNVTQHDSNINSGFKLNSSSTSSDFNPEKVLDNASSSGCVEFTNYK
ncbi:hypothetical protein Leryth_016952 [Lithospermum erythrorhizon]|nr:hypothetical protein Leryth_016952 [Lithospermum erythrorhizon]